MSFGYLKHLNYCVALKLKNVEKPMHAKIPQTSFLIQEKLIRISSQNLQVANSQQRTFEHVIPIVR